MFLNHCLDYKHRDPPLSHFHHTLFHVSRTLSMLRKSIKFHILFGCFVIQNKHSENIFIFFFSSAMKQHFMMVKVLIFFFIFLRQSFLLDSTQHIYWLRKYHHKIFCIITFPTGLSVIFWTFLLILSYLFSLFRFFKSIKFSSPFVDFMSCDKCQQQEHRK